MRPKLIPGYNENFRGVKGQETYAVYAIKETVQTKLTHITMKIDKHSSKIISGKIDNLNDESG